jgi:ankyrin repeat protein
MTPQEKKSLDDAFLSSAKDGNLHDVKKYFMQGADINAKDDKGYDSLKYAADNGNMEIATFLIANGADINAESIAGNNALSFAASKGHLEMASFLIAKGIDKDHQNHIGNTPLIEAVHQKQAEMVRTLLSCKVSLDPQNEKKLAAIHFVRDLPTLYILLNAGADINAQAASGLTPLMLAIRSNYEIFAKTLVDAGADIRLKDAEGMTALHYASSWGWDESLLHALVEAGADVYAKNNRGLTPTDIARNRHHKAFEQYMTECMRAQQLAFKKGLSRPIRAPKTIKFKP